MATDAEIERAATIAAERVASRIATDRAVTMEEIEKAIDDKLKGVIRDYLGETMRSGIERAVSETLISFGLDPKDRNEVNRDFMFLRDFRKMTGDTRKHIFYAMLTVIIGAMLFALWTGTVKLQTGRLGNVFGNSDYQMAIDSSNLAVSFCLWDSRNGLDWT